MTIEVLKSKIHRVRVTQANLNYVGSITIDEALMEAANLISGEKVQVVDITNGARLETYVIKGERNSGIIALPWTAAYQAPLSMGFSRQEYWSGVPSPSPMDGPREYHTE